MPWGLGRQCSMCPHPRRKPWDARAGRWGRFGEGGRTDLVPGPLQQQQPELFQAAVDAVPAPLLHQRLQHLRPPGKGERADRTETQRGRAGVRIPPLGESQAHSFPDTPAKASGRALWIPLRSPSLPAPAGSMSVARLLSLPGLLHSPLSVLASLLPSVSLLLLLFYLYVSVSCSLSVSVENFAGPLCAQTRGPQGAGL